MKPWLAMAFWGGLVVCSFGAGRGTTLHTNFYYFGDIKEIFRAYTNESGKLVKHGKYRGWHEDGYLWHEINYRDGQRHGTNTAFHHNGQKSHEAVFVDDLPHGLETTWDRDGKVVARGVRTKGRIWTGTFVEESGYSTRGPGDEDIEYRVAEYREGERRPGEPKTIFDDGTKWKPAPAPPDYRRYLRWKRYPYEIRSSYPYLKQLPPWSEVPVLLKWMNSGDSDAGVDVSYSQLVALSRSDFGHPGRPPEGGMAYERKEYYRKKRSQAWAQWWETIGGAMETRLGNHGRKNTNAWKLVHDSRPLPDTLVTIPDSWVMKTSYRAGDYFGVVTETITLQRTKLGASLIRGIRRGTEAPLEWEEWSGLTIKEADDFAFALAYAIDHPWLLKPKAGMAIQGRDFSMYYPTFRYSLADSQGNVWWNDDPWSWNGAEGLNDNSMNVKGLGAVCRLLWRRFPEKSKSGMGWTPLPGANEIVLELVVDDLSLRGEILDILDDSERLRDALEALTQFGTRQHLLAIDRFEKQLPARFGPMVSIVDQDPNGHFDRGEVKILLERAAEAKAAILMRDPSPSFVFWGVETIIGVLLAGLLFLRWKRLKRQTS